MTELTTWQQPNAQPAPAAPVPDYQTRAVQRLAEWAQAADAAFLVAERLVQSSFVPVAFRGKPIEAAAAILAGSEVGLSPMAALRSFDVIGGQAAPRAITLRAVVQSFGHDVVVVESTTTRCVMRGRRRGTTEWQTVQWTLDRAKDLGLTSKDGWKKQPTAMLIARATSEICRLVAADAILGIGYTTEELVDGAQGDPWQPPEAPAETTPTAPAAPAPAPATRTMRRRRATPPPPEPEPEPEAEESADDEDDSDGITKAQMKALHASFNDAGITARATRLTYCSNLLGRELTTSNDLTKKEASQVIDALKTDLDQ